MEKKKNSPRARTSKNIQRENSFNLFRRVFANTVENFYIPFLSRIFWLNKCSEKRVSLEIQMENAEYVYENKHMLLRAEMLLFAH